jgi:ATP adenylyltransferase
MDKGLSSITSPPGELRSLVEQVTTRALASGALQPIATTVHHVSQAGVRFVVRMLARGRGEAAADARCKRATIAGESAANPFLPHEPALFVSDLSETHFCLLNKFPVVAHHLLIVTRAFVPQEALLTEADFAALLTCIRQIDGLAFYNAGKIAGASQRHKHLQLAPFPLDPDGIAVPIAAAFGAPAGSGALVTAPQLPFAHVLMWLPALHTADPATVAAAYRAMLIAVGVWDGSDATPRPYNWLATRDWMLVAPRLAETVGGMAVNGLGFAGSLLVRNPEQLAWLQAFGPLCALRAVSTLPTAAAGAAFCRDIAP